MLLIHTSPFFTSLYSPSLSLLYYFHSSLFHHLLSPFFFLYCDSSHSSPPSPFPPCEPPLPSCGQAFIRAMWTSLMTCGPGCVLLKVLTCACVCVSVCVCVFEVLTRLCVMEVLTCLIVVGFSY